MTNLRKEYGHQQDLHQRYRICAAPLAPTDGLGRPRAWHAVTPEGTGHRTTVGVIMSGPRVTAAQQQQYAELLPRIGAALLEIAPVGWRRIDLIARIVKGIQDVGLTVIMPDTTDAAIDPPPYIAEMFARLRTVMYVPERGAWLSARYTIDPPGEFRVFYNYDHDPRWNPPIPPEAFRRDLGAYPRPTETIPSWLRHLLEPVEANTDPSEKSGPVSPPLGIEGQRDLTRKIADLLVLRAPADRTQIRVMYRATGDHEETIGHVLGIDGRLREWEPAAEESAEYFRQLRSGMYRTGVGTWTEAAMVVEYPITTSVEYRTETRWRRTPPRQAVLDELELFPRATRYVPAWMAAILPERGASGRGDEPAAADSDIGSTR